jgi:hypothetical protein
MTGNRERVAAFVFLTLVAPSCGNHGVATTSPTPSPLPAVASSPIPAPTSSRQPVAFDLTGIATGDDGKPVTNADLYVDFY